MSFQKQVGYLMSIGVPGAIASNNPLSMAVITDNGGGVPLTAGSTGTTGGLIVAHFAWLSQEAAYLNTPAIATNSTSGTTAPDGFVHRENTVTYGNVFADSSMVIPAGYPVSLLTRGDVYALSTTAATRGQKVFASTTDGSISTGAAGATVAGSVETKFTVLQSGAVGEIIKIGTDV